MALCRILACIQVYIFTIVLVGCSDHSEDNYHIEPPNPPGATYPILLHERDVIHYVDINKEFVYVGNGAYANITQGELRDTGTPVIIKKFGNSPFYDIMHEARIHRHLEHLNITPRLIGFIPAGDMSRNISLVYEYVTNSRNVYQLIDDRISLTRSQWIQVCMETAMMLRQLHLHEVLYNDLHRKNILVQKVADQIKTYIIDFGLATYKTGKLYKNDEKSIEGYNYLAPELVNRTFTNEASDVFAVGYVISKITKRCNQQCLRNLGRWCLARDPKDRPDLTAVIAKLEQCYFEETMYYELRNCPSQFCLELSKIRFSEIYNNETNMTLVFDTFFQKTRTLISSLKLQDTKQPLFKQTAWIDISEDYLQCNCRLQVLNEDDFVQGYMEYIKKADNFTDTAIRLGKLKENNETVIVKEFYDVDFEDIRHEACVNALLAEKGVAPLFIGLAIEYKLLKDAAFVEEYFGAGVTLKVFVEETRGYDWSLRRMKAVAQDEDYMESDNPRADECRVNLVEILFALVADISRPVCKAKSLRQRILENISLKFISHTLSTHEAGVLINNLRLENTIVKWNDTVQRKPLPRIDTIIDIRLIDLALATSLLDGIQYKKTPLIDNTYHYLAPEVVLGWKSTVKSDTFSMCYALQRIMKEYFSANDVASEFGKYRFKSKLGHRAPLCQNEACSVKQNNSTVSMTTGTQSADVSNRISPYSKYQDLLLKCLSRSPKNRPSIQEIFNALHHLSFNDIHWLWF
ncbi:uncharacterized protein LOC131957921 [Physella acuta]|uniref:uncharacterized protein LOC131957921 n=1 Tax=Physella acuta TaxID=109671 RepID=UPI0027DEA0F3|nr:uncharacterized protein LOC131957921 [Physella acuta]